MCVCLCVCLFSVSCEVNPTQSIYPVLVHTYVLLRYSIVSRVSSQSSVVVAQQEREEDKKQPSRDGEEPPPQRVFIYSLEPGPGARPLQPHPLVSHSMLSRVPAILFLAGVAVCAVPLLLWGPRVLLVSRLRRLELENAVLRDNIQKLSIEGGGIASTERRRDSEGIDDALQSSGRALRRNDTKRSCETIHVAMVVAGYPTCRAAATLIKSLLFYRHNPIHLHLVTDPPARETLAVLLSTWRLPAVNVSFYSAAEARLLVDWVPNIHYSGVYGLMKLSLADLLPAGLARVVVLDTDLVLAADLAELWAFFAAMRRQRRWVAMAENQSDWYLGKLPVQRNPWPALGRGFNSGVMLLDLRAMRRLQWRDLWTRVARATLRQHAATTLADQDIFNAVIKDRPGAHYVLPCFWNVQISDNTLSNYCFQHMEEFKIIHWNSPKKTQVASWHAEHFRPLYRAFEQYNGQLLRRGLLSCSGNLSQPAHPIDTMSDPCGDLRQKASTTYRTHPYFLQFSYHSDGATDTTLVAQLSLDRLHMLEPLAAVWSGPISLAVYATDSEANQLLSHIQTSPILSARTNLGLHVVYKEGEFYPVNYLRNVALSHVCTATVFLTDIDFLPMQNLYSYIREAVRVLGMAGGRRALVVPAFESLLYKTDPPEKKEDVLQMLADRQLHPFRQREWPVGHTPTNYEHWKTATVPYRVRWASDYEPYVVVSSNVSRYDERFVGFGWNKVSHMATLAAQGYDFVVLPDAFIIHLPHAPSLDIIRYRSSAHYRDCAQVLKKEFLEELKDTYGAAALSS